MFPLHHTLHGAGPLLVLLHGLGSSADDWELQVPAFSQHYTVLTLDLRGHGRSLAPGARPAFTIPQMADDVAALVASPPFSLPAGEGQGEGESTRPPAHVLGLSLGGCVAQALAIRHPRLVRSLVLVNTFARLQPAGLRGAGGLVRRLWLLATAPMPALAAYIARGLFPKPEQRPLFDMAVERLGRNTKAHYWAAMRAVAALDLRPQLAHIQCPALIIAGDRDRTVPRAAIDVLRRGLPHARFALVPDSGHATPYDQTEIFNRLVLDFLADADAR
jgi:pimeloyl-ACP methyl ester carboxylesterase